MAQVPNLSLVPTIGPSSQGLPHVGVNTPVAAFGGATADALSGLGRQLERSGDELFARAQALQQLKNETDAKDEDIKFMISAGEVHAKYNALQGNERVAAFPKYSEDLQSLYRTHRGNLTNPMAQRMFDSSAVSTVSRSIFNGAGSAATAQKEAAQSSIRSMWDLRNKQASDDPSQDPLTPAEIARIKRDAHTLAGTEPGGDTEERAELLAKEAISKRAYERVLSKAKTEPFAASQLMDEYNAKGYFFGQHYDVLKGKVGAIAETTGTKIIADQTLAKYRTPEGGYSKSVTEMRDEAVAVAKGAFPNLPTVGVSAESTFERQYEASQRAKTQDQREVRQQLDSYIMKGIQSKDQLPQELINRMSDTQLKNFDKWAYSYHHDIEKRTNAATKDEVLGLYNTDKERFFDLNINSVAGLSQQDRKMFMGLQQKGGKDDPRGIKAFNVLNGSIPSELEALGVQKTGTLKNKFIGALHEGVQTYQETYGKPPDPKTIRELIYPAAARKIVDPEAWFFPGTLGGTPFFDTGPPAKFKAHVEQSLGEKPSDEVLHKLWMREQFKELWGATKTKKDEGRVPR